MYRITDKVALEKRANNKDDPRYVFYEALLLSSSREEYIQHLGGNIAVKPKTYKRPVTALIEYRYVTKNREWIIEEGRSEKAPPQRYERVSNDDKKKRKNKKMKICRYVMTNDSGLAPNPYHGWCTLALCTPNHKNAKLSPGDWIVGHSDIKDGNKLIYAMRVEKVLNFNQYFNDPDFQNKKPKLLGEREEQCGDNFYYSENGQWRRLTSWNHNDSEHFIKDVGSDLKGRPVFVSQDFYYFGDRREPFPDEFKALIKDRHGITYKDPKHLPKHFKDSEHFYSSFVEWLRTNSKEKGQIGKPRDDNEPDTRKPLITGITAHYGAPPQETTGSKSAPHESQPEGDLELTPGLKPIKKRKGGCG